METFNPEAFSILREAEKKHFWFLVRKRYIYDTIKRFVPPPAKLLEIGCGTGNVSHFLSQKGYDVTGCEFYQEAIDYAWPGFFITQGDACNLPFEDESFDIVGLFDVIEHFEDDAIPLKEAARVAKTGGFVAVTVPSRKELWSNRDAKAFHKRRYEKGELLQVLSAAGLEPLLIEYMFMSLYLPMKYSRKSEGKGDQFEINPVTNALLKAVLHVERLASGTIPLPIGTSLISIARKSC